MADAICIATVITITRIRSNQNEKAKRREAKIDFHCTVVFIPPVIFIATGSTLNDTV